LKSIKFKTRNYDFQRTILSTTYILHIEKFPTVLLHAGDESFKAT